MMVIMLVMIMLTMMTAMVKRMLMMILLSALKQSIKLHSEADKSAVTSIRLWSAYSAVIVVMMMMRRSRRRRRMLNEMIKNCIGVTRLLSPTIG